MRFKWSSLRKWDSEHKSHAICRICGKAGLPCYVKGTPFLWWHCECGSKWTSVFALPSEGYRPPPAYRKKSLSCSELRSETWAKTHGRCWYCGQEIGTTERPMSIDHIVSEFGGGGHELENLVPACKPCNSRKGDRTLDQFRRTFAARMFYRCSSYCVRVVDGQRIEPLMVTDEQVEMTKFWGEIHQCA